MRRGKGLKRKHSKFSTDKEVEEYERKNRTKQNQKVGSTPVVEVHAAHLRIH